MGANCFIGWVNIALLVAVLLFDPISSLSTYYSIPFSCQSSPVLGAMPLTKYWVGWGAGNPSLRKFCLRLPLQLGREFLSLCHLHIPNKFKLYSFSPYGLVC